MRAADTASSSSFWLTAFASEQGFETRHVTAHLPEPRRCNAEIHFSARNRHLERRRIDGEERLALRHALAFPEIPLEQNAAHARPYFEFTIADVCPLLVSDGNLARR